MWTPVTLSGGTRAPYGFGWHVDTANGHPRVWHGGGLPGFIAHFARYLDDRVTIAVVMNTDDADETPIAQGVAAFFLAQPAAAR